MCSSSPPAFSCSFTVFPPELAIHGSEVLGRDIVPPDILASELSVLWRTGAYSGSPRSAAIRRDGSESGGTILAIRRGASASASAAVNLPLALAIQSRCSAPTFGGGAQSRQITVDSPLSRRSTKTSGGGVFS